MLAVHGEGVHDGRQERSTPLEQRREGVARPNHAEDFAGVDGNPMVVVAAALAAMSSEGGDDCIKPAGARRWRRR